MKRSILLDTAKHSSRGQEFGAKSAICLAGVGGQIVSVICSKKKPDDGQESVIKFRGALRDLG